MPRESPLLPVAPMRTRTRKRLIFMLHPTRYVYKVKQMSFSTNRASRMHISSKSETSSFYQQRISYARYPSQTSSSAESDVFFY